MLFHKDTPRLWHRRALLRLASLCAFWGVALSHGTGVQAQHMARDWNEVLLESIRADLARPTVHARNLHHWSLACYDAWAAYDSVAAPFLVNVNLPAIEDPVARRLAQEEAINYASYRLLWNRFSGSPGGNATLMSIFQQFALEGGVNSMQSTDYLVDGPAALGNYIAQQVLAYGHADGSNEINGYANQHYTPSNPDMFIETVPGNPFLTQPNRWQHQPQHVHWPKWGARIGNSSVPQSRMGTGDAVWVAGQCAHGVHERRRPSLPCLAGPR